MVGLALPSANSGNGSASSPSAAANGSGSGDQNGAVVKGGKGKAGSETPGPSSAAGAEGSTVEGKQGGKDGMSEAEVALRSQDLPLPTLQHVSWRKAAKFR